MHSQLGFDFKGAGLVAALPYLACTVTSVGAGYFADRVIAAGTPKLVVRKAAQTVGELLPGLLLVLCGYVHDRTAVVALLTLAVGANGIANAGYGSNHLDIAPQYAGLIFGITNTLASVPGLLAPIVVGYILAAFGAGGLEEHVAHAAGTRAGGAAALQHAHDAPPPPSITGWRVAFDLSGVLTLAGWAVYMRIARADPIISFERECYARGYLLASARRASPRDRASASGGSEDDLADADAATGGGGADAAGLSSRKLAAAAE